MLTKAIYQNNLTLIYTEVEEAYTTINGTDWHQRMGYIGQKALELLPKATTGGTTTPEGLKYKDCETYIKVKATVKVSR